MRRALFQLPFPINDDYIASIMAELDGSQEAARNVDGITESEPVKGEDLKRKHATALFLGVYKLRSQTQDAGNIA